MYLTVGDSGTILSSTDVQVWSSSKAFTTANLNDVVFHNSRFIAAGDNSALLVSDPVAGTIQRESRLNRFFDISMKGNTFRYNLPYTSQRTIVSLFDIRGRLVQSIHLGKQSPGIHQVAFPLRCAPGSYIVSFSVDGFKSQKNVVMSK
jgi:hypothetical protein